ncbi:MAG: VacB/RNase II family 3'-5' exoribonuclease [Gammaproteobacteria bacterium]|nr:VacB/RNase II family 3'-5' exoribonuclease [Gammaproteobacteria bacterium]
MREALAAIGPAPLSQLIGHLKPRRGNESRAFRQLVEGMLRAGDLALNRHGVYRLAVDHNVAGKVVRDDRALVLQSDDGERLTVVAGGVPVRPGDRATGIVDGREVRIATVVQPASETLVGLLYVRPRAAYVESLDPDLKGRIDLVSPTTARTGAVVEVEVLAATSSEVQGRVVRVIEAGNEAARAAEALLAAHRIPREWRADPRRLNVPQAVSQDEVDSRRDLRDLPLATIDGADARDFDDAVFAEPKPRGGWRLVVAIADVAHYVKARSGLDRDARERGNSVYLPDRVVPMLPEALSNGICSLVPNEDRLAVVCDMEVSARGRVSSYTFYDAVIHSHGRLTYDAVGAFLSRGNSDVPDKVAASLKVLHEVYRALRVQRDDRGGLDFDAHETTLRLQDGRPVGVDPVERTDAHRLIEEAMIAANVAAARHLEAVGRDHPERPPPIYRVHEPPAEDKLAVLAMALGIVGEKLPQGPVTPRDLADVAQRARAKSRWPAWVWDALVLRALAQARYEPARLGHFGLALPTYVHFTSPIRRYADLLVHRAIKGEVTPRDELHAAAGHISMTERRAEDVERAVDAWLKCALLEDRIGETFRGIVAGVAPFGLFVELDGTYIQGLVHVSRLGRDYYDYKPETMSLVAERSGARFTLADAVEVVLEDVSVATGRIDLTLADRRAGRQRRRRRA